MTFKRAATLCIGLVSVSQLLLACSASDASGDVEQSQSALVLADAARCEPGRFENTVGNACLRADDPIPVTAAPLGSPSTPQLALGR